MSLAREGYQILQEEGLFTLALKGIKFLSWRVKEQTRRVKGQIYKIGSSRICPICGFTGRKFVSAGTPPRQEAQCPGCGARERHRLLWHYIKNETTLTDGGNKILQFAQSGKIVDDLKECGNEVITTDLMMDVVDVNADITRLPFEDGTFDVIICSHVLEHISEDRKAMSEVRRVLDSEGDALIMIPKNKAREQTYEDDSITSPEARRKEFGAEDHVRWYGKDFDERLSESGFNVSIITYADRLDMDTIDRCGLRVYHQDLDRVIFEDIHLCQKSNI